jgi:hypothetical protein
MSDGPDIFAHITVGLAIIGGGVALYNARNAVRWKRAELASSYLRDLTTNPVLIFACRALTWDGGRLAVPESLEPVLGLSTLSIEHDPRLLREAMKLDLSLPAMQAEPRLQVYRMAMDDLLSWLEFVANALDRRLFHANDLKVVAYWIGKVDDPAYHDFIDEFDYGPSMKRLKAAFAHIDRQTAQSRRNSLHRMIRLHVQSSFSREPD